LELRELIKRHFAIRRFIQMTNTKSGQTTVRAESMHAAIVNHHHTLLQNIVMQVERRVVIGPRIV
jgi:hypothetical protein